MKILTKALIGIGIAVLLSGCAGTQPAFSPGNKGIVFINGKPYLVPYGSKYVQANDIFLKSGGNKIGCKRNSALWIEGNFFNELTQMKKSNINDKASFYLLAARSGKMGCVPPLSDKEYQYYLNQQNQQMVAAQQQATQRMYNQQMMQNTINNNNQMLMWQNNQFYRNLNTINNNTASWWRYTH